VIGLSSRAVPRASRPADIPQDADDLGAYFADVTRIDLLTPEREKSLAAELATTETAAWRVALAHDDVAREIPRIVNPLLVTPIPTPRASHALVLRKADPDRECIETLISELKRERSRPKPSWWRKAPTPASAALMDDLRRHGAAAKRTREAFVTANLRLVIAMAKRYRVGGSISLPDLIQDGNIGLMHAVGRFDPERGLRFSTFACWWIRHFIGRAIENTASTVRIPVHMRHAMRGIETARTKLTLQLGRAPTTSELATAAKVAERDVTRLEHMLVGQASSLNEPLNFQSGGENTELTRLDVLEGDGRAPDDSVQDGRSAEQLQRHIARLKPMEADIIRNRFGFAHREDTFKEIGKRYSLTRERIRQVQEIALDKLRGYVEHDRLEAEARRFAAHVAREIPEAKVELEVTEASSGRTPATFRMDVRIGPRVAVITWCDDRRYRVVDQSPGDGWPMDPAEAYDATVALALAQRALAREA
jgi:RNA polymerase primary sigma factor